MLPKAKNLGHLKSMKEHVIIFGDLIFLTIFCATGSAKWLLTIKALGEELIFF
jgi:hypothetical protein